MVDCKRWEAKGMSDAHLGRTGLERLHGPAEHLELALGERGAGCGGGGASLVVGHVDVDVDVGGVM